MVQSLDQYSTVLFDLDGTLTDPREGITRSVQYALTKLGIDAPDLKQLEHFIGPPLLQCFMSSYDLDEATAWQAVNFYRERFRDVGLYENQLFEGIIALLTLLNQQGRTLYMATSKPREFAEKIAHHFGFAQQFKVMYGSELDGTRTDKGELIAYLVQQERLDPHQTLMIGDRKHDVLGARRNQICAVAVEYGFGSAQELDEHAPDFRFASVAALHQAFAQQPLRTQLR